MAMDLYQVGSGGQWWSSGWFWIFIICLVILVFGLLRYTWWSPRGRR